MNDFRSDVEELLRYMVDTQAVLAAYMQKLRAFREHGEKLPPELNEMIDATVCDGLRSCDRAETVLRHTEEILQQFLML